MTPHARQRGISLLEVIVMLVVLFVLVPVVAYLLRSPPREFVYRAYCMNNLKQIGTSLVMYSNENSGRRCPYGPMGAVQTDPSDPMSMKGGLFDGGSGLLREVNTFRCPQGDPTYCPTTSQYLRSWWASAIRANVVIAGDYQDPRIAGKGNHGRKFSNFLFNDGHAIMHVFPDFEGVPLDATNIPGVSYSDDDMYNTVGDAVAGSGKRTALIYNDGSQAKRR